VITGVGAVTPLGLGAEQMHRRWVDGVSGIEDGFGRCGEFEPADHLTLKAVRRTDRFTQLAIVAAREALTQAGWEDSSFASNRVGCVIGTGVGGLGTLEAQHDVMLDRGAERVSPLAVPMMMSNAAAGVVAMEHELRGPCWAVASACASGADAIGQALRMIRVGSADACVAGGSEAGVTPLFVAAFTKLGALSPSGIPRPFDARRDGYVMAEGAGIVVLEEEQAARERGAQVLGRVTGYGATADAHHLTAPDPTGGGAARAMGLAMRDAGIGPEDIDYVNAHGTGTPLNDRAETAAIKLALGDSAARVPISSLKSAIGHPLGASGAIEAIATLLALRDGIAPPTLNHDTAEDGLDLDYVPAVAKPLSRAGDDGRRPIGISNAFGFGGHNAVLCIEPA